MRLLKIPSHLLAQTPLCNHCSETLLPAKWVCPPRFPGVLTMVEWRIYHRSPPALYPFVSQVVGVLSVNKINRTWRFSCNTTPLATPHFQHHLKIFLWIKYCFLLCILLRAYISCLPSSDFHDGGVGGGVLLSWLEFFHFVDARLILLRHHAIGRCKNPQLRTLGAHTFY